MQPKKRHQARILAVQVLYAWQVSQNDLIEKIKEFILKQYHQIYIDMPYFHEIIAGVIQNIIFLDQRISPCVSRKIEKLDYIEKNILRISSYEIFKRKDIPYKVIINEGIELAKIFGSCESHKFINGVLEQIILRKNSGTACTKQKNHLPHQNSSLKEKNKSKNF